MLGRDYELFGTNGNILRAIGDNEDLPFAGPVKVRFVDKVRLAVIDNDKGLHIQNLNGGIEAYIIPKKESVPVKKNGDGDVINDDEKSIQTIQKDAGDTSDTEEGVGKEEEKINDTDGGKGGGSDKVKDEGEPTNYMDLSIIDLCTVPMSKHITVCDSLTTTIKLVNREEWVIERHLGETRGVFDTPQLVRLSGVTSFQIGFKVFYAVSERCNRIQILTEGGKTLMQLNKSGLLPGEFNDPMGIASYISQEFIALSKQSAPEPEWYRGEGTKEDLDDDFDDWEDKKPGDFLFVRREGYANVYDGKYVTPGGLVARATVVKSKPERDIPSTAQLTLNEATISMMPWPSVWEAIAHCPLLRKTTDPRPYVLLAVNDKGNKRVQVFKYFWTRSELFLPAIVPFFVVGGMEKGCNCELFNPQAITFTPTGEVAVCDDESKKITIVSTVSRSVIRVISLSYITQIENIDNPSIYYNFPLARNRDQRARVQAAQDQAYKDYLRNYDVYSKKTKLTKAQFLGDINKRSSFDPWCTSIDFSEDGKLAIGFRMGSVLVLKPYKASNVGTLTNVEHASFNLILDFCDYAEYEALRECCRYLHNYTSRRRQQWALKPLRGIRHKVIALVQFVRWAKLPNYMKERLQIEEKVDGRKLKSNLIDWMDLLDKNRNVCCCKKWLNIDGNVVRGTKIVRVQKQTKKKDNVPSYLKKKEVIEYENKKLIDYQDATDERVKQSNECDIFCSDLTCKLSHELPVFDINHIKKYNGYIDLSCTLLAVSKLCGDVFLYKNEAYVKHLFEAFAEEMEIETYHDPMTRNLEVIREKSISIVKCIQIESFMELMLICEEDAAGAKPLRRQFLFHRNRVQRKYIPKVVLPGPAKDVLEHGNLLEVVKSEDDLGCLLHANEIIQYRDGISVPHKKNTNKKYRKVTGAEEEERGVHEPYKLQYNKAFVVKADRAEKLLDSFFS